MKPHSLASKLTVCALFTAILCIISPFSIPLSFSPVPLTMQTLAVLLCAVALPPARAVGCVAGYLALGAAGLPVFSRFTGGLGIVAGPTGGFLVGFLPMALLVSWLVRQWPQSKAAQGGAMLLGSLALYLCGAAWFCLLTGRGVWEAVTLCILPFLPLDLLKMAVCLFVLMPALKRIRGV